MQSKPGVSYAAISLLATICSFSSSLLQAVAGLHANRCDPALLSASGIVDIVCAFGLPGFYLNPIVSIGIVSDFNLSALLWLIPGVIAALMLTLSLKDLLASRMLQLQKQS